MTTEEGDVLGSEDPEDTELRLCMEDRPDMPETVESVMLGAGLRPRRMECRLETSSAGRGGRLGQAPGGGGGGS